MELHSVSLAEAPGYDGFGTTDGRGGAPVGTDSLGGRATDAVSRPAREAAGKGESSDWRGAKPGDDETEASGME